MMIGIQIAIDIAVDGEIPGGGGLLPDARITDDLGERITDDNQTRITDGV
jgi:hypothetical protein